MKIIKKDVLKRIIELFLIFLVVSSTRIYISANTIGIYTTSDEVSAISIAPRIAGFDWSDVVSQAGYYGIGYLFIYAPLFRLGLDSLLIYKIMILGSAIILGFSSIVCNKIIHDFFPEIKSTERMLFSMVCGCMSFCSTYQPSMRNEEMLILVCWLISYCLFEIIEHNYLRYRIALIILCLYSLTLHERAAVFAMSLIAISIVYFLITKKRIVSISDAVLLIIGAVIIKAFLKMYRNSIWSGTSVVRNTSVTNTVVIGLSRIGVDKYYLKSIFSILFGVNYTTCAVSCCLFAIALTAIIIQFGKSIKKDDEDISSVYVVGIYSLVCYLIILIGLILTWGDNVYYGFKSETTDWFYHYKAFTYLRYPGFAVPTISMTGLIIWHENPKKRKEISLWSGMFIMIMTILWHWLILPYISNQKALMFLPITALDYSIKVDSNNWVFTMQIVLLIALFWILVANKKHSTIIMSIFLIIYLSMARIYAFNNIELKAEERVLTNADAGVSLINYLKENTENKLEINSIDVDRESDHQIWYLYQFYCYDVHIIPNLPNLANEEIIILTNGIIPECEDNNDILCYQLDNNEYIYYKGDSISSLLQNYLKN
ncbi:hypothetical protein [Butyrivibrio sp. YAB3001]|uniref:hypothetical protein n=1 Tax=Butyrivibrio sp. YAB3001 TaxID=1520812 RepID=UPI0008F67BEC|nr:hypothetical protein [Butyrivibrio sp. YAB3001]SFC26647.1 hypothetical protein SAMN02910398_01847 [Butyrivibrio sp. YAB3001]